MKKITVYSILRLFCKCWTIFSTLFFVLSFTSDPIEGSTAITFAELVAFIPFPLGTLTGSFIAWKKPKIGSIITAVSLAVFYGYMFILRGEFPMGIWFLLFSSTPFFLYIIEVVENRSKK